MTSMSYSQLAALEQLYDRRAHVQGWIGSLEGGPHGMTIEALERRGLAEAKYIERPYARIVGRITAAGITEVERRRRKRAGDGLALTHAELDVLEGIVRTADAGSREIALSTIDRLRSVAS